MRCGACQTKFSKGSGDDRSRCDNHKDIPTDTKCIGCRKHFCAACLNSQKKCFMCAMKPAPEPVDPKKRSRGTGSLKGGAKTGKLKKPQPEAREFPLKLVAGVGAGVLVVALGFGAMTFFKKPPAPEAYQGPASVAIVAPGSGQTIRGGTFIKLKVGSPQEVDRVEVTIDGKYWERFRKPPFSTHWPTSLFKNGDHTIQAKVFYRGGAKTAVAKKQVRTWNQP